MDKSIQAIYGYCEVCKMELNSRDEKLCPPNICEGCFTLEMNEEYYPQKIGLSIEIIGIDVQE